MMAFRGLLDCVHETELQESCCCWH